MTVGNAVHDVLASMLKPLLGTATPIDRQRLTRHTERTLDGLLSGLADGDLLQAAAAA
ncbi:hypothetical protein SynWH8101_1289 [Synechococcus sp. WH 8101]|uniref:hypothetical protein n=1 Tax=Synechococcus sp. WH 8101 TaxID=59932 RepID=UPI0010240F4A|nr:hypothetical protein [Synechococcus sp. WH 8101]QBE68875.1 hypothetical protein SynWH8101_1289 [Synechococcus sp. WH 8101]QNI45103.1 hypothetical protein SynRCC2555_01320 [Synechococcus sp. WH 8101]